MSVFMCWRPKEKREVVCRDTMAPPSPLSKANTTFALALLQNLGDGDKTANVFFSPFSISSALAMVMLGARGDTATQMSTTLKMQDLQDDVHVSFAQLLSELNKEKAPYVLSVANRLYGAKSYKFIKKFVGKTKEHYKAELESVDFKTSSESARVHINSWVEKQTQGKIKDLLGEGVVNRFTKLVLVNAIYFKGSWDTQFNERDTRDAIFSLNKNECKTVKMMYQQTYFPLTYISAAKCQILEMPYKGNELSMLIFLPNEIMDKTSGLEKLEQMLTFENFAEWTQPGVMKDVDVIVGLPRFKMEVQYDMEKVLVSMGMVDAFDEMLSDFSGMSRATDLVLSKILHKALVEVNEEGTEAAAATFASNSVSHRAARPPTFIADHPFLFFIRHNPSMSVLFAGRCCSPE